MLSQVGQCCLSLRAGSQGAVLTALQPVSDQASAQGYKGDYTPTGVGMDDDIYDIHWKIGETWDLDVSLQ